MIPKFTPRGKTPADIRAEIVDATNSAQAILDTAKAEGRDLSDAEAATCDRTIAHLDVLGADLRKAEQEQERKLAIAQAQIALNPPVNPYGLPMPTAQPQHRLPKLTAFPNTPAGQRDAYLAGQWFKAIRTGDEHAMEVCAGAGFDVRASMTEGGNAGYLVPTPLSNAIIEVRESTGVARRACRVVPMTSETRTEPKLISGPSVSYPGEGGEITASDETWGQVALIAKKRAILTKVSRELRDDAIIGVIDQLASRMGHEFAAKEDSEFIDGDSTSTYGGETGVLAAIGSAGVVDAATGHDLWSELDMADFTAAMAKLPSKYSEGALWICSMAFYTGAMLRALAAAGGNTMVSLAQGVSEGLFLGKRVLFTDYMPTTTATSTISVLYGNFAEGVLLGDRQGVEIAISDQRYFEFDLVGVRATTRYDINVHEPGDASNAGAFVGLKTSS